MRVQLFCCSLHFSAKSWQGKNLWKTANRVLKNFQKVKQGHKFVHCSKFRSFSQYWNWLQIWVALILFSSVLLPWNACKLPFTGNIYDIQVDNLHSWIQKFAVACFFCCFEGFFGFWFFFSMVPPVSSQAFCHVFLVLNIDTVHTYQKYSQRYVNIQQ